MSTVTKDLLKAIRPDIDNALMGVAKKHGLKSLSAGSASYDPRAGRFNFKLEGIAEGGVDKSTALYQHCLKTGFPANLPPLESTFRSGSKEYKITGINTTGSKVIAEESGTGKAYLFPVDTAIALWTTQNTSKKSQS